ncbi:MAG: hypothetical protein NPIRA05_01030 [Nitrospirales bacterium]|nr:MAG: hypothetical protein NPIRA05_01030 [Nitrospirales bacterium]GJL83987.1 MAG: hypothetical protein DHS20C01_36210 [marine bacterium B5-7]
MNDPLAMYTFLPWLKQGIGRRISTIDTLGNPSTLIERATIDISLSVNSTAPISNQVHLVGPGDVVGINPRAIIKTEPRNWITDFEPNYLPFIEFYEEDFPWRYTPAAATGEHRLRPWLVLAILAEDEFTRRPVPGAPLNTVTLTKNPTELLPASDQTWAWAHVHVSRDLTNDSQHSVAQAIDALENLVGQNSDNASSRLLCPRRLKPNTGYFAFVIPTFETGRLAGLGQSTLGVDALKPSWGSGQSDVDYPVYYEWFFRTGERGDFEFLVKLLKARSVDARVGIRDMDMQAPNYGVSGMKEPPVIGLEGALRAPNTISRPPSWPLDSSTAFTTELQQAVNLQADLLKDPGPTSHPDPIISPPLYGRWHAKVERLDVNDHDWIHQLNGDPRLRVPSGLGTKAIQANQEDYMQRAWRQLGDVLEVNRKIRHAQLALVASHRIFTEKILTLSNDQVIATVQTVLPRVKDSQATLHKRVQQSRLPLAAVRPAFRRVIRPRGVLMKKVLQNDPGNKESMLVRMNTGQLAAAPKKTAPKKQISLDNAAKKVKRTSLPDRVLNPVSSKPVKPVIPKKPTSSPGRIVRTASRPMPVIPKLKSVENIVGEQGLNVNILKGVPFRQVFKITEPGKRPPLPGPGKPRADSKEALGFRAALTDLHARFDIQMPKPPPRKPLVLQATVLTLKDSLNPAKTIPKRIRSMIAIPPAFRPNRPVETIEPIMAHPVFADPMYVPLRDQSPELLIPNLNLIPMNTIALLETNRRFIEAYMVGLNHEMSRELLWREYPTDQRGSYFRQFWDVSEALNHELDKTPAEIEEALLDVQPIHTWGKDSKLGDHAGRDLPTGAEQKARLVVVIRGDLLKKYPTAVIFAQRAKWAKDENGADIRVLDQTSPEENLNEPIFKAEIEPDLKFLGFDLTAVVAKGSKKPSNNDPGWFFVIKERPGEPRFGLDLPSDNTPPKEWNELAWNHLAIPEPISFIDLDAGLVPEAIAGLPDAGIRWGSNSADMAYVLFQSPVMVAFHAADMLSGLDSQS